jgi:hypothetical protein
MYLSEKVVVFVETKGSVSRNVNFELKYIKTDPSVSRQNTQKFNQSHTVTEKEKKYAQGGAQSTSS